MSLQFNENFQILMEGSDCVSWISPVVWIVPGHLGPFPFIGCESLVSSFAWSVPGHLSSVL